MLNHANARTRFTDLSDKLLMSWPIQHNDSQIINERIACTSKIRQIRSNGRIDIYYISSCRPDGDLFHVEHAWRSCIHRPAFGGSYNRQRTRLTERKQRSSFDRVHGDIHFRWQTIAHPLTDIEHGGL